MSNREPKPDSTPPNSKPDPERPKPFKTNDIEEEEDEDDENDLEDDENQNDDVFGEPNSPKPQAREARYRAEKLKMDSLLQRMQSGPVSLRVHDVIIKGNTKTKDHIIEAETEELKSVSSMQELLKASQLVNLRLQALEVFDSVKITLDSGPPELPGTANVIIEVVETANPLSGQIGAYTKAEEFDLRYAVPLGFYRAALNFGISGGVVFPLGNGFLSRPSSLPERFFLGGNMSPVCTVGGPTALWGFKTRGLGPTEPRRKVNDENTDPSGVDFLGGDLAVTALADLSFDLPFRWFREKGIHAHVFACTGNVAKLTENEYRNFSVQKFVDSLRSSVGVGLVVPTSLFRMELNYCYILRKFDHDRAKTGFWLTFSGAS
ncbi:Outer membrane OMP85 family protein isoform 2 [Theobroma cacao]|uniref:Outer membrane OMP85 family protein isoform 2 n=1 Tax=Theobroma cacao TaxID=3641 RepID=A0A061FM34_THECC|nr:Outer membrane OMP85 family protein isoform 2 [Theobroma cacao]